MPRFLGVVLTFAVWFSCTSQAHISPISPALPVPPAQAPSIPPSDSGVKGPKYVEILAAMEALQKANPDLVTIVDYGTSVKGRTLRMVIVKKKSGDFDVNRPALLMTGSTHGNEYLNIEDRLPGALIAKAKGSGPVAKFVEAGGVFVFVPILNPDGYDTRVRENANGVDLNRDWDVVPAGFKGFKEVETRALATKVAELKGLYSLSYKMTLDYHCCIGALLHPWSYEGAPKLDGAAYQMHKDISDVMLQHLNVEVGTTGDVLGYYPLGTTKDYYFATYGAAAFTYEGKFGDENKLFDKHLAWWEGITQLVNIKTAPPFLARLRPKKSTFPLFAE